MSPKYKDPYNEITRSPIREEIKRAYRYANDLNLNFKPLSYEKNVYWIFNIIVLVHLDVLPL